MKTTSVQWIRILNKTCSITTPPHGLLKYKKIWSLKNDRSFTRTNGTIKNNPIVLKKERNAFLKHWIGTDISLKERLTLGTHSFYQERILSQEGISNQKCVLNHLEIIIRPSPYSIPAPPFPDLPPP